MRIFIDTEFNSFRGELISLALVDENGRGFYRVLDCPEPHEWVAQNVIPVLNAKAVSMEDLQFDLQAWLSVYHRVHIIADWPEDIEHFCRVLITGPGMRINTPLLTMEVDRLLSSEHSVVPHNALYDALAIREQYMKDYKLC